MASILPIDQLYQMANSKEIKRAKKRAVIEGISEEEALIDLLQEPVPKSRAKKDCGETKPFAEQPDVWKGWFDGSCDPATGDCTVGAYLESPSGEVLTMARPCMCGSSATAEYEACIALLEMALDRGVMKLAVYGDAKGVIDQINNQTRTFNRYLRILKQRVGRYAKQFEAVEFSWVPRKRNRIADRLCKVAAIEERERKAA